MERQIIHCDLDTFFVSVERLKNSALSGKPVLIGGSSDRGVVASCSYEARQFGVHSAMPMRLARQLCPQATVLRGDMDQYGKYSAMVTEILSGAAPLVEKASIDEHYLDVTGLDRYFGTWQWTQELRQKIIRETGLPISFGLSANKTVSKVATSEAKPSGECRVGVGNERSFLAPLSIRRLPMIGEKTYSQLRHLGISQVGTLQQMSAQTLRQVLGKNGATLWKKANGIDDTPVVAYSERKSISQEHTFERDTIDLELLHKTLHTMTDVLAFELRRDGRLASCMALKIRYSNFDTHTMQVRLPYISSERVMAENVMDLFGKLYSRRMLIRLVGVKLSGLVQGHHQVDLFRDTATDLNLTLAMDRLKNKYGSKSVVWGTSFN